jgi:hypothetical protein
MEQRPLRLGDLVDDYCPRERRITNHAIVALVGEQIRQCRCTTCDAEHVYKGGKVPRRLPARKDGEPLGQLVTPRAAGAAEAPPAAVLVPPPGSDAAAPPDAPTARSAAADAPADPPEGQADEPVDGWLAHRPLIRATLPRTEGDAPTPRPIPEFTMHQRQARGGRAFRQGHGWGGGGFQQNGSRHGRPGNASGNANGNVAGNHGNPDRPQGHGRHGQGGGRPGRHRGGGSNKRSR